MSATRQAGPPGTEVLSVADVSKTFPGGRALDAVSLIVRPGEVHALVGMNGSGKSTLVKCIAGVQAADPEGIVTLGGASVDAGAVTPRWSWEHGVRVVHQKPGTFPDLTVAENLGLGHSFPSTWGVVRDRRLEADSRELLEHFGVLASPKQKLRELAFADQTMVAIIRTLRETRSPRSSEARLLIFDEPTAALPRDEAETVLSAVRRAAESGLGVIYVSHRLEEVVRLADHITVLRDGKVVESADAAEVTQESLIASIVGRRLAALETVVSHKAPLGERLLEVEGLSGARLSDITLKADQGEVLGIAGLLGSGGTELLRALYGCHDVSGGTVRLDGQAVEPRSPGAAMALGIAYISAQRDVEGAFPDLTVRDNLVAANLRPRRPWGVVNAKAERDAAGTKIAEFGIKTAGDSALMSSLSGGNQQRVVMARCLAIAPRLVLIDEPTQGVDVDARVSTYEAIDRAASDGAAVIVASSDFKELAEICHRVLVLADGQVAAELKGEFMTEESIAETVLRTNEVRHAS